MAGTATDDTPMKSNTNQDLEKSKSQMSSSSNASPPNYTVIKHQKKANESGKKGQQEDGDGDIDDNEEEEFGSVQKHHYTFEPLEESPRGEEQSGKKKRQENNGKNDNSKKTTKDKKLQKSVSIEETEDSKYDEEEKSHVRLHESDEELDIIASKADENEDNGKNFPLHNFSRQISDALDKKQFPMRYDMYYKNAKRQTTINVRSERPKSLTDIGHVLVNVKRKNSEDDEDEELRHLFPFQNDLVVENIPEITPPPPSTANIQTDSSYLPHTHTPMHIKSQSHVFGPFFDGPNVPNSNPSSDPLRRSKSDHQIMEKLTGSPKAKSANPLPESSLLKPNHARSKSLKQKYACCVYAYLYSGLVSSQKDETENRGKKKYMCLYVMKRMEYQFGNETLHAMIPAEMGLMKSQDETNPNKEDKPNPSLQLSYVCGYAALPMCKNNLFTTHDGEAVHR
ncbi:hypothetical protein RFI_05954 [Reticulomyxa filosa]|uniref:Uncharacterized protein n=1 Tax=Reticulomyxa filosa TaxID=46433 RepID=X6P0U9_RETFI|nr:hypothetical protein RFI_05954 [Reticulomyxa filosa]|eukprot:ETO31162.1 hypothetical protein RFI_05954 [Reticulomyxa filosa]